MQHRILFTLTSIFGIVMVTLQEVADQRVPDELMKIAMQVWSTTDGCLVPDL